MKLAAWLVVTGCWTGSQPAPLPPEPTPTVPLPKGPYATHALAGPYSSRTEWCRDLVKRVHAKLDTVDESTGCLPHDRLVTTGPMRLGPSGGAITSVELAAFEEETDDLWGPRCALLLHTAGGIWANEELFHCLPPPGRTSIVTTVVIDELRWADVIDRGRPGEALGNELVLRATIVRGTAQIGIDERATSMIVCGAGSSARPRCTPVIPVKRDQDPVLVEHRPSIAPNGTLRFELVDLGGTMMEEDVVPFARPHSLRFP